jgi:type I restriction enzyme, S subunit
MKAKQEGSHWPTTTISKSAYLRGRIGWQGLKASEFLEEGPFLVTGTDFTDGRINWDSCYHVSESRYAEADYIHLKNDDVVITKDGTIGKVALVQDCPEKAVLNSGVFLLRCNDNSFQHRYIFHLLKSNTFRKFLDDNLAGSTIQHLYQHIFKTFEFPLPDLREQTKIAEILSTVDRGIEQTDALIAKQQRIKTGLMQDLLTRGIDEHGTLRSEQTHAFKDSPLGRIPVEWKVGGFENYVVSEAGIKPGPFGSSLTKDTYVEAGYRVYGQEQVIGGTLDIGDYFISGRKYSEMAGFSVKKGDVLISLVGTIGHVLIIPAEHQPGIINPRLLRFRPDPRRCLPQFLKALLLSQPVRQQLDTFATGGTMPVLSGGIIRKLGVVILDLNEQKRIIQMSAGSEEALSALSARLAKLRSLKTALMQDLLTGIKRVMPLLEPNNPLSKSIYG